MQAGIASRTAPVRILIVDDDAAIRRLFRRQLEGRPDWQVCGEAANGQEAVLRAEQLTPGVAVIDRAMPLMNGLQAARQISKALPQVPMLLLTVQEVSVELAKEARNVGFRGAVSKSTGMEVVNGIEVLLRGESFFRNDAAVSVLSQGAE